MRFTSLTQVLESSSARQRSLLPGFSIPYSTCISVSRALSIAIVVLVAHPLALMNGLPEAVSAPSSASPLEAFSGAIRRTKTGPLYSAGLAIVAFAMVLLPIIYLALIAFTAWAVLLHLKNDTWIFDGPSGRGGFWQFILYLGPAVAGGILLFFLVKPFFATKTKPPQPITLDPAKEPLLFAFVRKVCGLVGAPEPCRIDVDCQVNASAGLRRGLWSNDLVLTVGLPLAAGLDMRQFAGVLAHEFGHFAQGAGMRLTHVIRRINLWFARVVYERDEWDAKLEQSARNTDWRISLVLHLARGCVWVTRRILGALMHAGHAISCFMLRQMEYDADSYETKVAGSDAFEQTASQLRLLNVATQTAYEDVQQSWASQRLPENLPLLIGHKASSLPAEVHQRLSAAAASEKTGWFDTHPCDADRVRAARRLSEPGVFRLAEPATRLFSDFTELSKAVTRHQYEKHLELEFTEQNLMSAEEILRESAAHEEADTMIRKYYRGVNISLKPLLTTGELPPIAADQSAVVRWREARETTEFLSTDAEKASTECGEQQRRLAALTSAHRLAKAGFKLQPQEFGLPEDATTPGELEIAARFALEETSAAIAERLTKLDPFMTGLRQRVTLALRLAQGGGSGPRPANADELARLLAAVGAEMPRAHDIGSRLNAFVLLVQNRANHSNPAAVDKALAELAAELQSLVGGIQERLKVFPYPFSHARGRLTVAEYARFEGSAENNWLRAYPDGKAHLDRLFALNYRLIGRLLAHADAAETDLERQQRCVPDPGCDGGGESSA
jgi:Zn-dependent protease with chaperone function